MVTKSKIQELNLSNINDYYQFIINLIIDSKVSKARDLFLLLSSNQKLEFYQYIGQDNSKGLALVDVLNAVNVWKVTTI